MCSVKVGHLNVKMLSSLVSVRAACICAFILLLEVGFYKSGSALHDFFDTF